MTSSGHAELNTKKRKREEFDLKDGGKATDDMSLGEGEIPAESNGVPGTAPVSMSFLAQVHLKSCYLHCDDIPCQTYMQQHEVP